MGSFTFFDVQSAELDIFPQAEQCFAAFRHDFHRNADGRVHQVIAGFFPGACKAIDITDGFLKLPNYHEKSHEVGFQKFVFYIRLLSTFVIL
jgi:hypothetical protein